MSRVPLGDSAEDTNSSTFPPARRMDPPSMDIPCIEIMRSRHFLLI
jgi:hypothetical protein